MLRILQVRNVREAYSQGVALVVSQGVREDTRNGPVRVLDGPLITEYERPWERVLVDSERDANPFFHLMESVWMLAGRRDVESLMYYNAGMKKYSDDGVTFNGAYGWRWQQHFDQNQLAVAIDLLRKNPEDRRVVIGMWDPDSDLGGSSLDHPCNTQLYLRARNTVLDMTICCRSNDMVWGGYGANAVHFSVLHEFLAAMIGVEQGRMYQLSNNAHVYDETRPKRIPTPDNGQHYESVTPLFWNMGRVGVSDVLQDINDLWDDVLLAKSAIPQSTITLVREMRVAWRGWKTRNWDMFCDGVDSIPHEDWQRACMEWGARREEKFR